MLYHVLPCYTSFWPSLPSQKFSENPGSSACHAPLATASGSSAAPYFAAPTPWPPLSPPPQAAGGWVQTSVESPWKLGGLIYHYTSLYHIYPKNTPNLKFARSLKDVKWPRNCEISYRMHLLWWLQTPGSSFNVDSLTGVPKCPIVQFGRALQTACQTATFRWSKNPKNVKWETFITPLPNWSIWCPQNAGYAMVLPQLSGENDAKD